LLAATASTMIGPTLLLNLRKMSENAAIQGWQEFNIISSVVKICDYNANIS
jgi:hypothetical protein